MIPVNPTSAKVLKLLGELDDEAFGWLVLALLPSAMLHGARTQVWPDGAGGFRNGAKIEEVREEAKRYTIDILRYPAEKFAPKDNGD